MSKVKVGLIGAGFIARQHLDAIAALDADMIPVGITSRTPARAVELASEYGIECFGTVDDLVAKGQPDALMVLVSVEHVARVASRSLEYGIPLFIEKPAGIGLDQSVELRDKAERLGVSAMVGFNRRFYSVFEKGVDVVRRAGPLLGVAIEGHERLWRIRAVGKFPEPVLSEWVFANSVHTIDLLRFFGGEPVSVMSSARSYRESNSDQMVAAIEFEGGALGSYISHWYSPGGWSVRLFGDGVSVEFNPLEDGYIVDSDMSRTQIEPEEVDCSHKPGFVRQLRAFANLVRTGELEPPAQDLAGSLETARLAARIAHRD